MPCSATFHVLSSQFFTTTEVSESNQPHDPFSDPSSVPHFQPRLPLRPIHIDLRLDFDISKCRLIGTARHKVVAQCRDADVLTLNAEDFDSVNVSSTDDPDLDFTYDGHVIQICLSKSLEKGQSTFITIDYVVTDPIDGLFYSRAQEGHFVVSDHETERARYWLPVVDHPIVRTTLAFDIKTPAESKLTALANGEFVKESFDDGSKITSWKMDQPTPSYLICIAVGDFVRTDLGMHGKKPLACFAAKGGRFNYTPEHLNITFGRTPDMIKFLEDKLKVELPWPKYFQWAVGEVSGAMENSSLVSYDEWYLLDKRCADERCHRVDSTVVHELAHTWFGDQVVCADFAHSFLKESFATLISAEWFAFRNGIDDFQYTLINYANVSFAETSSYHRPIVTRRYDWSWSMFDSHLYTNGAWRLHMLRHKLGHDQFWDAVSFYLKKRAWAAVETDDFRRDLEEYSGEELVSYFYQWFYSKGHPVIEASFSYNPKDSQVSVSLKQTQASEKKGIGLYDLTFEIAVELSSGWETHKLVMHTQSPTAHLSFKVSSKPLQIIFDPDMKVLHNLTKVTGVPNDMVTRSLTHAPSLYGRYQAMKQLQDGKSKRGRAVLCEALKAERHWGLRTIIAKTLGNIICMDSLPYLIEALETENDARALPAIVSAIGMFEDPEAERVLLRFLDSGEEKKRGYGAMASALRGLGRQRKLDHIAMLKSYITDKEKRGGSFEMAQGAATGLGEMRQWDSSEVLMELLEAGKDGRFSGRLRASMVRALINGVVWENVSRRMKAFEFVRQLLRFGGPKMYRLVCGFALASLADAGNAAEALDELGHTVDNQSELAVRRFKRTALQNANARDSGIRGVSSQVEKMLKEMRELKAKMEDLQAKVESRDPKEDKKCVKDEKSGVLSDNKGDDEDGM